MNWAIIEQVVIMALLAGVGILCRKLKLLDDACTKKLSTVVLNFATPMVILVSYQKPFDPETLNTLLLSFLIAIISYVIAFILVPLIVRSKDREGQLIERFSCLYSHCAFMGIPLIQGVYGTEGVFCLTAYVTMFNLCSWTHGVIMMKGGKPNFKQMMKSLLSPSISSMLPPVRDLSLNTKQRSLLPVLPRVECVTHCRCSISAPVLRISRLIPFIRRWGLQETGARQSCLTTQ